MLATVAEAGILTSAGPGAWQTVAAANLERPEPLQRRLYEEYPSCGPELDFLAATGPHLADVVTGRRDGLELLFPNGDLSLAERLYHQSPAAVAFNEALARAVDTARSGRRVRILEIGAGTGSATAQIAALLDDRVEYVVTDISPAFTAAAAKQFRHYPFITCRPLDIEREPAAQGFEDGSFDFIVASNVLHATEDLEEVLCRVRSLLRAGGLLFLIEVVKPHAWMDLTVGLTPGWWKFRDRDLRPDTHDPSGGAVAPRARTLRFYGYGGADGRVGWL